MKKAPLFIFSLLLTSICQATNVADYCIPSSKEGKSNRETTNTMTKLFSVSNFSDLKKLQHLGPDGFNSVQFLMLPIATADYNETTILDMATKKYTYNYYFKNKEYLDHVKEYINGEVYGFDGSLFNLLLSIPQSSFLLYDDNQLNIDNQKQTQEKMPPKASEEKLLNLLISDEERLFYTEKNNTRHQPLDNLKKYSTDTISDTYSENEVKGDLEYKRKRFATYGIVDEIKSSLADKPAIIFRYKNDFRKPTAFFKQQISIEKIAEINKGDALHLVCDGGGEFSSSALLTECEFFDDYLRDKLLSIKVNDELSPLYDIGNLSLAIKLISAMLPESSPCFTGDIMKCKIDIFNISPSAMRLEAIKYAGRDRTLLMKFEQADRL